MLRGHLGPRLISSSRTLLADYPAVRVDTSRVDSFAEAAEEQAGHCFE